MSDWNESRAILIGKKYRDEDYAPFGDAPLEYLTGKALATKGICDAMLDLLVACPDANGRGLLARLVAERVVVETLKAEGKELVALTKVLIDYTEGMPVHREPQRDTGEERERIITLVSRAQGYSSNGVIEDAEYKEG